MRTIVASAHPSLGLIKYWGKRTAAQLNIPSTTSIGITLDILQSDVTITFSEQENATFLLNDVPTPFDSIVAVQKEIAALTSDQTILDIPIKVQATNNFPTSAGLASSSSGFAALAHGLSCFYRKELSQEQLSSVARVGSGSACRAVFEGFTVWEQDAEYAKQLCPSDYWDDFRIITLAPYIEEKHLSSRQAMIATAQTSPYFESWNAYNTDLARDAVHAIEHKDIEKLGELILRSYTAMHACALAAYPSICYWKEKTLEIIDLVSTLRNTGIAVWETLDAGPEVKLITLSQYTVTIQKHILERLPKIWMKTCKPGPASAAHIVQE